MASDFKLEYDDGTKVTESDFLNALKLSTAAKADSAMVKEVERLMLRFAEYWMADPMDMLTIPDLISEASDWNSGGITTSKEGTIPKNLIPSLIMEGLPAYVQTLRGASPMLPVKNTDLHDDTNNATLFYQYPVASGSFSGGDFYNMQTVFEHEDLANGVPMFWTAKFENSSSQTISLVDLQDESTFNDNIKTPIMKTFKAFVDYAKTHTAPTRSYPPQTQTQEQRQHNAKWGNNMERYQTKMHGFEKSPTSFTALSPLLPSVIAFEKEKENVEREMQAMFKDLGTSTNVGTNQMMHNLQFQQDITCYLNLKMQERSQPAGAVSSASASTKGGEMGGGAKDGGMGDLPFLPSHNVPLRAGTSKKKGRDQVEVLRKQVEVSRKHVKGVENEYEISKSDLERKREMNAFSESIGDALNQMLTVLIDCVKTDNKGSLSGTNTHSIVKEIVSARGKPANQHPYKDTLEYEFNMFQRNVQHVLLNENILAISRRQVHDPTKTPQERETTLLDAVSKLVRQMEYKVFVLIAAAHRRMWGDVPVKHRDPSSATDPSLSLTQKIFSKTKTLMFLNSDPEDGGFQVIIRKFGYGLKPALAKIMRNSNSQTLKLKHLFEFLRNEYQKHHEGRTEDGRQKDEVKKEELLDTIEVLYMYYSVVSLCLAISNILGTVVGKSILSEKQWKNGVNILDFLGLILEKQASLRFLCLQPMSQVPKEELQSIVRSNN
uniref:Uncharacterized protein n=1 Tax=Palpitomonas bilix TaxID=652834 RepID=A0A7S3G570_9EUKA